jgi:hypothetical protein
MKIIKVETKKQFNLFLDFPNQLYKNNPFYVAPLRINLKKLFSTKNPIWEHAEFTLFLAFKENKLVGRIAAFYFEKNQKNNSENTGYFGFFDTINNINVAKELLNSVKSTLKNKACETLLGPLNPNTNYELGVLIKGYDLSPYFMMNYNYNYYSELLVNLGGKQAMNFNAFKQSCDFHSDKIIRVSNFIKNKYKVEIQDIDFKNFNSEAEKLVEIYNDAFKNHWGFIPFSTSEFLMVANDMKLIMDKKLIFKVLVNNELAGFILALPNLNEVLAKIKNGKLSIFNLIKFLFLKRKIKWVKVTVAAIAHKYQHLGLGSVLYLEMNNRVKQLGYLGAEVSWVAENNIPMNKALNEMGGIHTKSYTVYQFSC